LGKSFLMALSQRHSPGNKCTHYGGVISCSLSARKALPKKMNPQKPSKVFSFFIL